MMARRAKKSVRLQTLTLMAFVAALAIYAAFSTLGSTNVAHAVPSDAACQAKFDECQGRQTEQEKKNCLQNELPMVICEDLKGWGNCLPNIVKCEAKGVKGQPEKMGKPPMPPMPMPMPPMPKQPDPCETNPTSPECSCKDGEIKDDLTGECKPINPLASFFGFNSTTTGTDSETGTSNASSILGSLAGVAGDAISNAIEVVSNAAQNIGQTISAAAQSIPGIGNIVSNFVSSDIPSSGSGTSGTSGSSGTSGGSGTPALPPAFEPRIEGADPLNPLAPSVLNLPSDTVPGQTLGQVLSNALSGLQNAISNIFGLQ